MTPFTKQNLLKSNRYLFFLPSGAATETKDRVFVARFKRGSMGTFMTHLRKNWTAEKYFARLDAGESPLDIVKSTGYLLPHIKKELKRKGYPVTHAGFDQLIQDQLKMWKAKEY
tara:strand:- start:2995 stop:3336 length:342 start_codon:yes stop_codon:yes gene_type:complete